MLLLLYLIIVFVYISIPICLAEGTSTTELQQTKTEYVLDSNKNSDEPVKISDVYEALLDTKNDKLLLLSNIIGYLLATAAIIITAISALLGLLYRKIKIDSNRLKKDIDTAEKLIDRLLEVQLTIEKELNIDHDYIAKNEEMSSKLKELEDFTDKLKAKAKMEEKRKIIYNINVYLSNFKKPGNPYLERMSHEERQKISEFSDIALDYQTTNKLANMVDQLRLIYRGVYKDGEPWDWV